jgi:hypothetical protein
VGYQFWVKDENGKMVKMSPDDVSGFEMTGLTQQSYKGQGRGRVGTIVKMVPKMVKSPEGVMIPALDSNDNTIMVEKRVPVIVTSMDPNRQMANGAYAGDYFSEYKKLKGEAQRAYQDGNPALAASMLDQANAAQRESMSLLSPELTSAFSRASRASTFASGPINIGGMDGSTVMVKKFADGKYRISILDPKDNTPVLGADGKPYMQEFKDDKAAMEYTLFMAQDK